MKSFELECHVITEMTAFIKFCFVPKEKTPLDTTSNRIHSKCYEIDKIRANIIIATDLTSNK